ncbi:MAG TPA: hypothetical protein VEV45_20680 [Streptosporangiaceae bacterium]|nr:hypothetical protein [Streptosporangiaceae bacterium]
MSTAADRDTTAHRYLDDREIATIVHSAHLGLQYVLHERQEPPWPLLTRYRQDLVTSAVEQVRRGVGAADVDWGPLGEHERIKRQILHLTVVSCASVQLS